MRSRSGPRECLCEQNKRRAVSALESPNSNSPIPHQSTQEVFLRAPEPKKSGNSTSNLRILKSTSRAKGGKQRRQGTKRRRSTPSLTRRRWQNTRSPLFSPFPHRKPFRVLKAAPRRELGKKEASKKREKRKKREKGPKVADFRPFSWPKRVPHRPFPLPTINDTNLRP